MPQYTTKPLTISAAQFLDAANPPPGVEGWTFTDDWNDTETTEHQVVPGEIANHFKVTTASGWAPISRGDWSVMDQDGVHWHVVGDAEFRATVEIGETP